MRRALHPLWILLALIFLIEAWLWDHLEPIVARIVALIPLRDFKLWLATRVALLSPAMTLIVFIVPVIVLFPLKLVGVWLLANHYWFSAGVLIVFSKVVGVGVAAFIFDVTRPKLLQMVWFRTIYEFILDIRRRANRLVAPIMGRIRMTLAALKAGLKAGLGSRSSSRWMRIIQRMRSRAHSAR